VDSASAEKETVAVPKKVYMHFIVSDVLTRKTRLNKQSKIVGVVYTIGAMSP